MFNQMKKVFLFCNNMFSLPHQKSQFKIMKAYSPSDKLVVRDSLLEDELSDDVEDDVFIRDGRTCKTYEDKNLKRPLMAPRKKYSRKSSKNSLQLLLNHPNYKKSKCWRCWEPFCYGLGAILVLTGK